MNRKRNNVKTGMMILSASSFIVAHFLSPMVHAIEPDPWHWKDTPPKIIPENYVGHVHKWMPFVDGKLAMSMERIDRTNGEIEFSIDRKWLNGRKIKRVGFAAVKWYDIAINHSDIYEANEWDNEWAINIYKSKDNEPISDMHDSTDRIFWIKTVDFNLAYETTNDIVFVLYLDDGVYYNGRVKYNDCDWYPGYSCRVEKYDETKTSENVKYEPYRSPRKYVEGMAVRIAEGYTYDDNRVRVLPMRPSDPSLKLPDTPKPEQPKPEVPKPEQSKPEVPKSESGKTEVKQPQSVSKNNVNSETVATLTTSMQQEEGRNRTGNVLANNDDASKNSGQDNEDVEVEPLNNEENEVDKNKASDQENISDEDKTSKNEKISKVPKLGDVNKQSDIFSIWWVWLLVGTGVSTVIFKIFLPVLKNRKKKTISD